MDNKRSDVDLYQRHRFLDARVFRYAGLLIGSIALSCTLSGQVEEDQMTKVYEFASGLLVCSTKLDRSFRKDEKQQNK